ncbi:GGDEF domain-containing protein [Cyanobium gracile]|uniref:GGDEF domain-containing protein n=1 Tax=Cyanobium gracile UHCC 0281 TaxID=3110309 RepID=A0ABU5SW70_9CYAN|nr:GGDEF domain-containing protein [Cyanobium gracile]MEA5442779.1 GGDEF domain-containing protein [Cyanobium gracile UHCC 0281]
MALRRRCTLAACHIQSSLRLEKLKGVVGEDKRMTSEKASRQPSSRDSSLGSPLNQNQKIKVDVVEAATEPVAVHEVIMQAEVPAEDLRDAHSQNTATEEMVATAAAEIKLLNQSVADGVVQRTTLESDLVNSKTELDGARDDVAEARLQRDEARQGATKDPLTNVPNRSAFDQRLEHGLSQSKRHGWGLAIFSIDVDQFTSINDSYGHDLGDEVLQMVATRLTSFLREDDMVSRWGGDEFVCLLLEVGDQADVMRMAKEMVERIAEPCVLHGDVLRVRVSIGIAIFPAHGSSAEILLNKADLAMYEAKGQKDRVVLFHGPEPA